MPSLLYTVALDPLPEVARSFAGGDIGQPDASLGVTGAICDLVADNAAACVSAVIGSQSFDADADALGAAALAFKQAAAAFKQALLDACRAHSFFP